MNFPRSFGNHCRLMSACLLAGSVLAPRGDAGGVPGDVLWRVDLGSPLSSSELAVGPNGRIYAMTNVTLQAFEPDGTPVWTRDGIGGGTAIDFLEDGAIVVSVQDVVYCLEEADGSTRWTFTYDSGDPVEQIHSGPNVGPDGNIYAVTSVGGDAGLGAFSLTPAGELRWSDVGDPLLDTISGSAGGRVYFSADRVYFGFRFSSTDGVAVYGYDFDGNQTFQNLTSYSSIPRIDPQGRVILTGSALGIHAVNPDSGEPEWVRDLGNFHMIPAIAPKGTIFTARAFNSVTAIAPDGSVLWDSPASANAGSMLAATDGVVVYAGAAGFGVPDFVGLIDAANGDIIAQHTLLSIEGLNEFVHSNQAAISPDGSAAYFTTRFGSNGHNGALYAVRIAVPVQACPADVTGDGNVDLADLNLVLANFGMATADGDVNGDISVDLYDLNAVLAAFGVGCG